MAASPQFAATPKIGQVALAATADASLTNPVTSVSGAIVTGTTLGTRVNRIQVVATATTAAGIVRLFLHNGSAFIGLIAEVPVTAITPSATVAAFSSTLSDQINTDILPITLPSGFSIRATTSVAQTFSVMIHGADL